MPALKRLAWARALMAARSLRAGDARATVQFKVAKTIQGYRSRLLGEAGGGINLIDPFTPVAALHDLSDYLDTLADASETERNLAVVHVRFLADSLVRRTNYGDGGGDARLDINNKMIAMGKRTNDERALFADAESRGSEIHDVAERARLVLEKKAETEARIKEIQNKTTDADVFLIGDYEAKNKSFSDLRLKLYTNGISDELLDNHAEYQEGLKATREAWSLYVEKSKEIHDASNKLVNALRAKVSAELTEIGQSLIDEVKGSSPVTQSQAEQWASGIEIDRTLKTKLKNNGYELGQFKSDIAEFYRLTGGKLAKVSFNSKRGNRASASNVGIVGFGSVNVASGFNKRVLFHELAHHLESDPAAILMSSEFLRTRRKSERARPLASITGNRGYRSDEKAWEDTFLDPYVGKAYDSGHTEVFSMGIERFANPVSLAEAVKNDPQHMALMLGYIKMPTGPVFEAVKQMVDIELQANDEFVSAQEKTLDDYLDIIDKHVPFVKGGVEDDAIKGYTKYWNLVKFMGTIDGWYVYQSKERYLDGTKKMSPCFKLVRDLHTVFNIERDIKRAKAFILHKKQDPYLSYTPTFTESLLKTIVSYIESKDNA